MFPGKISDDISAAWITLFSHVAKYANYKNRRNMADLLMVIKALADRNRLRIMAALLQHDELCACQLTELLGVAGATSSRHLAQLQNCGLIKGRKSGRWVLYGIAEQLPHDFPLSWLAEILASDMAMQEDKKRLAAITAQSPEEICRRQRGGRGV